VKPGDLVVAYVAADGPTSGGHTARVTGGGMTWKRVARENAELGDAEVWTARSTATTPAAMTVKAMPTKSRFDIAMTVVSYRNAGGVGATATFHAPAGVPTGTVTTTQANSWVWAVGNDWLHANHRSVGPDQTLVHERLTGFGDTYWVQSQTNLTPVSGATVTVNDTAPKADPYNLILVEIHSGGDL
jgi:hypothetical protein